MTQHLSHSSRLSTTPNTQKPITLYISGLTHDGRGIATYDDTHGDKSGKKVFH